MIRDSLRAATLTLLLCGPTLVFSADEALSIVQVYVRAQSLVAEHLGVEVKRIEPNGRLRDLGMDELDFVEIIMALEEEFEISIPDEAVDDEAITTHRLAEVVVELLSKKK